MQMEMFMMVNGLKIKPKDMENTFMQMDQCMREHGRMINKMERGKRNGLTARAIKANTKMVTSTDKEHSLGQTPLVTQASSKTTS